MSITLSYDEQDGIARAIIRQDKEVRDCYFDRTARPQQTGAIIKGTVDRLLSGRGAFLKLNDQQGFLGEAEDLHSGQQIWVQVKNEPREGKAVNLTRQVTLPGVYVVHQPAGTGVHISRRLADLGEATDHLTRAITGKPGGWVIRSSALKATRQEIEQEVAELGSAGHMLLEGRAFAAPSAFEQALLNAAGISGAAALEVVVEEGAQLDAITAYLHVARPSLVPSLNITMTKNVFEQDGLEEFYEQLCNPIVPLPRGGNIKFERTDTLNVVDVNGGERTHFFEINRDAAKMVMNHLRWRNVGGIILIDFLKMKRSDDRDEICDMLDASAQHDASTCDIFGFTRLGLCEISRARRGYSLAELLA